MKKLCAAVLMIWLSACSHTPKNETVLPPVIVLIHGAHFDGESWSLVKTHLGDRYQVLTPDLLNRQKASASLNEISMDLCAKIPDRSVLVGHSLGGTVINEMTGVCPEKITRIIYLAALVPVKGETLLATLGKADKKVYTRAVTVKNRMATPKKPEQFFAALDVTLDKQKLPQVKLYPESLGAVANPVAYDEVIFAKIPKFYILTTQDSLLTLATQKDLVKRTDIAKTGEIASGHLPMLSKPQEVAQAILQSFQ